MNDTRRASNPPPTSARAEAKAARLAAAVSPKATPSKRGAPHYVEVKRMHRRDINRAWEFLKLVFRGVNLKTVEYQRPRSKSRFEEVYDDEGVDQLLYVIDDEIVGYTECSYSPTGTDNWMNPRYFDKRGMRPLFVDEIAVHPLHQGHGVGGFMLDQLQHLARTHGCTHLVLEVAENNKAALSWYNKRNFFRLDAAIFLAQKVPVEPELLPPRAIKRRNHGAAQAGERKPPAKAKTEKPKAKADGDKPPASKTAPPNGASKRGREEEE